MPSIVYAGVRYIQTRHAIPCSTYINYYTVDGGISDGNRILGNLSDIEDRSMYCAIVGKKKIWLPCSA